MSSNNRQRECRCGRCGAEITTPATQEGHVVIKEQKFKQNETFREIIYRCHDCGVSGVLRNK